MASLHQVERELTAERTRAGLAAARKLGRVGGRKRLMTGQKVAAARNLLNQGTPPREVAHALGIHTVPAPHLPPLTTPPSVPSSTKAAADPSPAPSNVALKDQTPSPPRSVWRAAPRLFAA